MENMRLYLKTIDWVIFFFVILITLASVIYGQLKKPKSSEKLSVVDHLIMGRQLTLPLFIFTLVATWYGGIFGVTQIAFESGLYNLLTQGIFWYAAYLIFAFVLLPKIQSNEFSTLPEMALKLYGPKSEKAAAILNIFNLLPMAYIISVGLFIQALFQFSLNTAMLMGLSLVIAYSFIGGLRAVVFSDLIQFFVMCISVFLVIIFSYSIYGGIDSLKANLPESYFSFLGNESMLTTCMWGLIALSTLVDPNFYNRCFAARSEKTAKRGIILSTLIWFLFDLCTTFGAMYAKSAYPNADSKYAYLNYALSVLPDGLKGFFLAGVLATILSTLDSYLFLSASTLSYDLAPKKYKYSLRSQHLSLIIIGFISYVCAVSFEGNIKIVWKTLGSLSAGCLLIPLGIGKIFNLQLNDNQFVKCVFISALSMILWKFTSSKIPMLYLGILSQICYLLFSKKLTHKLR